MEWNLKLKLRRIALELSREEAADLIGVNTVTYGRWERGENMPLPAFQKAIGQAFEIDEWEIFKNEEDEEYE